MIDTKNGLVLCAILVGVTLVLAAQAAAGEQDEAVEPTLRRYVGTYQYVGGDEDIEALDEAIDEVVSQMNFFIRGIARRRLREPNLPSKKVVISVENGQIRIDRPGQPEVSAPADGAPITWRHPDDGDVFQVRHGIDEHGVLYQRFKGDRSVSRNDFVLGNDGERLTIVTEITADRLPAPLRFEMSYRRMSSANHRRDCQSRRSQLAHRWETSGPRRDNSDPRSCAGIVASRAQHPAQLGRNAR